MSAPSDCSGFTAHTVVAVGGTVLDRFNDSIGRNGHILTKQIPDIAIGGMRLSRRCSL
ncbi:MAG: hypothetical protein AB8B55_10415 [Mariniblastus sp.]